MEDGGWKNRRGEGGADPVRFGSVLALWFGWWDGEWQVMVFVGKPRGFSDML
jgi:hypothetical protein